MKHIPEAGNLNYGMSEYAAYFSYTIFQISRYSNMLQMCRALSKCVLRLSAGDFSNILEFFIYTSYIKQNPEGIPQNSKSCRARFEGCRPPRMADKGSNGTLLYVDCP